MSTEVAETSRDKKAEVILLLARGLSADAVSERTGVPGRTIRGWRDRDPGFEDEIRAVRMAVLGEAVGALTGAVKDAVATLHEALREKNPSVRVRAASELLKALPALSAHVDLEHRIAALEAASGAVEGGGLRAV